MRLSGYPDAVKLMRSYKTMLQDRGDFLFENRRLWPWLVLLVSLLLIAGFSAMLMPYLERQENQELRMRAQELASSLEQRMNASEALLNASGTAFAFVPNINRDFFASYFKGLDLDIRYRGMVGVGWAYPVARQDVPALEARIRGEGRPDYFVWPVLDGRANYPILYLEPDTQENRRALGFNMYSEPARRKAMIDAFTSGKPRITAPVMLKQEGSGNPMAGFLIYAPVFDATRLRGDEAPKRTALRGYVYAAFRVPVLIESAMRHGDFSNLDFELYDVTDERPQLLHDSRPEIWSADSRESVSATLDIGGRTWKLVLAPVYSGDFFSSTQRLLTLILIGTGVVLSLLVALLVRQSMRSLVSSRTALARQVEQLELRSVLMRELNHRVKNTLATVNSLAALSRQGATDVGSYYEALNGRLRALSATHDLLTSSDWGDTDLRDIASAELAPFRGAAEQVVIEGPSVMFDPNKALSIGLSIHELATNASKYGALSIPEGRVKLKWETTPDNKLFIRWLESGGPVIAGERRPGFGSVLIERLMARQLRAQVDLSFPPDGVVCEFRIPLEGIAGQTAQWKQWPRRPR